MATKMKMTGIRLTDEQNYKIRYIAEKHHRKLNDEFRMIVEKHIQLFELENGEIQVEEQ
ncbi:MAG: Arc family DNA-binding protein [Lachnoclostridium edouardi]|uniref:Arc family DNA-binding protein n=1 Tax=Lachnoclostridium edouardi TaxID=1926283 RepID=UPI0026DBBAD0|nr:Arc family DNA-binding protein [Lachnoclostridium edouardi]MDO4279636.1 Arc family DNA-binding protein [Lachnoclostridium edouardi]